MLIKLHTKDDGDPVWINGRKIDAIMDSPDKDGCTIAVHGLLMQFREAPHVVVDRIDTYDV